MRPGVEAKEAGSPSKAVEAGRGRGREGPPRPRKDRRRAEEEEDRPPPLGAEWRLRRGTVRVEEEWALWPPKKKLLLLVLLVVVVLALAEAS